MLFSRKDPPVLIINGTSYILECLEPDIDFDVPDQSVKRSVLTGYTNIVKKGKYTSAKYTLPEYTTALLDALRTNNTLTCCFYGDYSIDGRYKSPRCEMAITKVQPFHLNKKTYADALLIELQSLGYYELIKYDTLG